MSTNIFTDGIPLEEMCPGAHQDILSAARFLYCGRKHGGAGDLRRADGFARDAAETLHSEWGTGRQAMWLQVVRYAVELHAARLDAQAADNPRYHEHHGGNCVFGDDCIYQ